MSDTPAQHRRKVSREGIVMLKSFEGFRARAERDGDGWVIGYGHRRSAREGLTVGEADAELLLQYDLLPIVKALNALPGPALNGHQFDALASFAFSIGLDRFMSSEVFRRLVDRRPAEAADALLEWIDPSPPNAGVRRRAAERALFMADPERPVALSDLLSAPLPPPEPPQPAIPEPAAFAPAPVAEGRVAAVAALLGEAPMVEMADPSPLPELVLPSFTASATPARTVEDEPVPGPELPGVEPDTAELATPHRNPDDDPVEAPAASTQVAGIAGPPAHVAIAASLPFQRLAPYSAIVVGPLPGFAPTEARPTALPDPTPVPLPLPHPLPLPVAVAPPTAEIEAEAAPTSTFNEAPVEALTLTPAPEQEPRASRPAWDDAVRPGPMAVDQVPLFQDAPAAVSILRHEVKPEAPRRFDWSETGMYVIMGGLGLVSCAVSAAAFRVAVEDPSPMGETTAVAWTLAVIGAVCVGAASWHLYVRTTRRKG